MTVVSLNYAEQGRGVPVVLLHGYPLSSAIWREQLLGLSDQFRIIAPDLRGHGKSHAPDEVYEMDLMARDVLALLDSLSIPKAVIMGHSMGGYVTLAAWKMQPARFLGLGMIASRSGADTEEARQNRLKMAERVAKEGSSVVAESMIPILFAPGLPADDPIVEQTRTIILNTKSVGIIGALKGMAARPDYSPMLPNLDIPVLILAGDKDQLIPPQRSEAMAAAIASSTLVTVENAGHMPMLEQPHATTMAIRNFLSEIEPS